MLEKSFFPLIALALVAGACRTGPDEEVSNEPFDPFGHTPPTSSRQGSDASPAQRATQAETDPLDTELESVQLVFAGTLAEVCGDSNPRVYFEFDSATVREVGEDKLSELARCLNEAPLEGDLVTITGHADPRGTEDYNRELGLQRADAVARELVERGVDPERFDTYSRGEHLASEDPEAWDTDRRVVIRLDS